MSVYAYSENQEIALQYGPESQPLSDKSIYNSPKTSQIKPKQCADNC